MLLWITFSISSCVKAVPLHWLGLHSWGLGKDYVPTSCQKYFGFVTTDIAVRPRAGIFRGVTLTNVETQFQSVATDFGPLSPTTPPSSPATHYMKVTSLKAYASVPKPESFTHQKNESYNFSNESYRLPLQADATHLQRLQCIPLGQVWPSKLPPLKVLFCLTTSWFHQRETFLLNDKICFVCKSQRKSLQRSRGLKHEL